MPTHTLAAIVDQVSFLPQQGEHAMEELGPLTTAEGYVPKVACLFSLHVGTKSLFDSSKKTFEGRSPATFLICLPFSNSLRLEDIQ